MRIFLASASPARQALLKRAGLRPEILSHAVDEEALIAEASSMRPLSPPETVQTLAEAKALDACRTHRPTGLVFGGDSMFEIDGSLVGKPLTVENARSRWDTMQGQTGVLHSGHFMALLEGGEILSTAGEATSAAVSFSADISPEDLEAYIESGEPLTVAGAFTIDAKGAAFIDSVSGDPHTVEGLSIVTFRRLVERLGVRYSDLWV